MTTDTNTPMDPTTDNEGRGAECAAKLNDVYLAIPESSLIPITMPVVTAVATVLGALSAIMPFAEEIAKLPGFNPNPVHQLEPAARALGYLHWEYTIADRAKAKLPELNANALIVRERLYREARSQCERGKIDPALLNEYNGTNGYSAVASDVGILAALLSKKMKDFGGKCACDEAELAQAKKLSDQMLALLRVITPSKSERKAAASLRQRGYTYLILNYDQVRRAMSYLRWDEGDLESIAPSIYSARKKKSAEAAEDTTSEPTPDAAEKPQPLDPSRLDGPAKPASTTATAPVLKKAAPGSEPFMQ